MPFCDVQDTTKQGVETQAYYRQQIVHCTVPNGATSGCAGFHLQPYMPLTSMYMPT